MTVPGAGHSPEGRAGVFMLMAFESVAFIQMALGLCAFRVAV